MSIDWKASAELNGCGVGELKARFEKYPKSGKRIIAVCDECGIERESPYRDYHVLCIYCSNKKKVGKNNPAWKGGKIEVICSTCGKTLLRKKSRVDKYKEQFCNHKCYGEWKSKNLTGENNPCYKDKIEVICSNCGKIILRNQSGVNEGKNHFCNHKCKGEWRSKNMVGENSTNHKDKVKVICSYCSKELLRHESAIKNNKNYFCNIECYSDWMSKNLTGENNPLWKGGSTKYCEKFNQTCRTLNREKYDNKCFLCGLDQSENTTSTGEQRALSVHHVDMNKNQGCDDHDWRLVPLCMHHHGVAHGKLWTVRIEYLLENVWNDI